MSLRRARQGEGQHVVDDVVGDADAGPPVAITGCRHDAEGEAVDESGSSTRRGPRRTGGAPETDRQRGRYEAPRQAAERLGGMHGRHAACVPGQGQEDHDEQGSRVVEVKSLESIADRRRRGQPAGTIAIPSDAIETPNDLASATSTGCRSPRGQPPRRGRSAIRVTADSGDRAPARGVDEQRTDSVALSVSAIAVNRYGPESWSVGTPVASQ